MGQKHRISNTERLNQYLKLFFTLVALYFIYTFAIGPKTDCDVCEFKELGMNAREFEQAYNKACLQNAYEEKDYFYVDIDDINITTTPEGIQNLTFKS